ncbi:ATP-binding protein [Micromonospora sp. NPDC050417]|uniref:ATP-binding protein n=1 Tax=Micromonospora sp. NPDC050417 TaxID=3364280 RepID=UPI0037B232BA
MAPDHGSERSSTPFPDLLRARRRAVGLTQADLAVRACVGVRTVRDLERGHAQRPQRTTVELLATALRLVGAERADFIASARGQGTAAPESGPGTAVVPPGPRAVVSNLSPGSPNGRAATGLGLPAPGALVGRDAEVPELAALLTGGTGAAPAVVSLVGLAGVGKTALALAVADRVTEEHPGGVAGIVVTDLSTEGDVLSAVATVFGVGRAQDLTARLAGAPSLLLVDAVERSPSAVAEALHRLTAGAPTLRVLATGRHPVGLFGERVWPVAPLEVPPPDAPAELAVIEHYPAVELFLARLRQVRREPPQPEETGALLALVRRLGGLPLALELAAARGGILDLNGVLERYGDRVLDLARPAAAREAVAVTLRDAVAASYRLLDPDDRAALRRLSAFRNRWSVELAEAMLTGECDKSGRQLPGDPVPLLDRLLALGLLSSRGRGPFRFRLVDVVRDFAAEAAAADGEQTGIRRRHAQVFAGLAARTAPELSGANLAAAVRQLDEISSDLWAALAHATGDDPHTALHLAASLARWWRFRGRDVAGRQWLRRLLDDPRTQQADPAVRAWARVAVAQLAAAHGAGPQELAAVRAALDWFRDNRDVGGELAALGVLCGLWTAAGGYGEARRLGEMMLTLAGRHRRARDMAVAQHYLTWHEIRGADLPAARRRLAAMDLLGAECGDDRLRALARANLAEVARLDGRYADAVNQGRRVLAALTECGDPAHRRQVLGTVGLALAQEGRLVEAAAVLAELRASAVAVAASREVRPDGDLLALGRPLAGGRGGGSDDGTCALIEAILAVQRADREWAVEWYAAAASAYAGGRDLRGAAEALVGVIATTDDPVLRKMSLVRVDRICREGEVTLLPRERVVLASAVEAPVWRERDCPPTAPHVLPLAPLPPEPPFDGH